MTDNNIEDMHNCRQKIKGYFSPKLLAFAVVFMMMCMGAWAQEEGTTYIWTGNSGDGKWSTAGNWKTVSIVEQGPDNAKYTIITDASNPATSAPGNATDIVYITNTQTITLDTTVSIGSLRIANNSDKDHPATINLAGNTLTIGTLNLGTGNGYLANNINQAKGNLVISSTSVTNLTIGTFDLCDDEDNSLMLENINCNITDTYYINGDGHSTITGTGSTFTHPPADTDWGTSVSINFEGTGIQEIQYTVTVSDVTLGPAANITITISSTENFSSIFYKAAITGAETYKLNDNNITSINNNITELTFTETTSQQLTLVFPDSIHEGNGISFAIYSANSESSLLRNVLNYTQTSNETAWTGNYNTAWDNVSNWTNGIPAAGMEVSIPNDCTKWPVIVSDTNSLTSLTIANAAQLSITAGTLNATTITNNGTVTISGGTINGTTKNGSSSLIIYDGSCSTPIWGNVYAKLKNQSSALSFSDSVTITETLENTGSLTFNGDLTFSDGADTPTYNDVDLTSLEVPITFSAGTEDNPRILMAKKIKSSNKITSTGYLKLLGTEIELSNVKNISNFSLKGSSSVSVAGIEASSLTIESSTPSVKLGGTIQLSSDFVIDYPLTLTANTTFNVTGNITIKDSGSSIGSINSDSTARSLTLTASGTGNKILIQNGASAGAGLGTTTALSRITINSNIELSADTSFKTSGNTDTDFAGTGTLSGTGSLSITGNMSNTGTRTYNTDISVSGNVSDTGTWTSGNGKKITFNGTDTQTFTVSSGTTYGAIVVNKSAGNFNTSGTLKAESFEALQSFNSATLIVEATGDVTFHDTVTSTNTLSVKAANLIFNDVVTVKDITMDALTTTSKNITVKGNWTNEKALDGTTYGFSASAGTVTFTGESPATGADAVVISGDNNFNNLVIQNSAKITGSNSIAALTVNSADNSAGLGGKQITFTAGTTQSISGALTLKGSSTTSRLQLRSSSTGSQWKISCGSSDIEFVDIQDAENISTDFLFALNSNDSGNNTKWNFPGMKYVWTGANSTAPTNWNVATNWEQLSIPGKGADIEIPAGCTNYPILTAELNLNEEYNSVPYCGKITIKPEETETNKVEGKLDLAGSNLILGADGQITNNGLVRLIGASGQTINGKMINGTGSTVEYYSGTNEDTANFPWDGDNGTNTAGKQYANLIIKKAVTQSTSSGAQLIVSGTTTISAGTNNTVKLDNASNNFNEKVIAGSSTETTFIAGAVTLKAGSLITLANNANADSLTVNSSVKLQNVTTTGNQIYNSTVTLDGATTLKATNTNESISFNRDISGNNSLSVQSTNINIKCDKITTNNAQKYTGTVILENDVELKTNNGNITFSTTASTINSKAGENHSLTLNIPTGRTVTFEGEVGKSSALSSIIITQAGNVTFNKELKTNAFVITKATSTTFDEAVEIGTFSDNTNHNGTITFSKGGTITNPVTFNTTGTVSITGPMNIGTASPFANLTHENGNTKITGTLNAAEIKLGPSTKQTTISNGTISSTNISAGAVTINGANTTTITTTGSQSYTGDLILNGNATLTSSTNGNITFVSTIKGDKTLTLNVPESNTITVADIVSAINTDSNPPSITITKAGNVTFDNSVTTNAFVITQAAATEFKGTVTSSTFNITKANSTTFDDSVTITTFTDDAANKTDNGNITFKKGGSITNSVTFNTISAVSITGPMNVGTAPDYANLSHTAGNTNISGTLNAAEIELGTSTGTTTITSGAITAAKLEVGNLNAEGIITTSGEQKYNGTVALTDELSLKSNTSSINFASTITGAKVLTTNTTTGTSFGGNVGTETTPLTSLTVTGSSTIDCSNIYTSGAQTFGGALTLNADTTLSTTDTTNGNISFNSTLDSKNAETHLLTLNIPATRTATFTGKIGNTSKPSITITQAGNVSFDETVKANTFTITKATSTLFNKAVELASLSDSDTHNGTITFKAGGKISTATQLHTTDPITLTSTLEALSLEINNLVIDGTSQIKTTGTQVYNGTINGIVTTPDRDDELTLNSGTAAITFGGNIGQIQKLKTLAVKGAAQINKKLTFTADAITFNTSLTSTTATASTLTVKKCGTLTNPAATATVSNINFFFTGESGSTTNFIPGNSEYGNITSNIIELNFGNNAFNQNQNASFTVNSGTVKIGTGGFNGGNLIISGGEFVQTGSATDSVYDMKLTDGSLTWDADEDGGSLAINGTVTEGENFHINYNKKNIVLTKDNTISGVFWSLTIDDGITITNGGSIRIRKDFTINGQYIHNGKELILGLDKTNPDSDTTENGNLSNANTNLSNLGKVYINKGSLNSQTVNSDLLFTDLEILSGSLAIPDSKTITTQNLTNKENNTISNTGTIEVTKDFTDQGTYSGNGLLKFTGNTTQTFTPGTRKYENIENTSANPLTVNGALKAENFTINSGKATSFTGSTQVTNLTISSATETTFAGTTQTTNMTISSAEETTFADTVNIKNFTDTANAGNISFKNGGRISDSTGTVFLTTGILSLGDAEADEMTFGSDDSPADFIHTEGDTKITGTLNAKTIKLGDTNTALTRILSGIINAESLTTGNLETEGSITTTDFQQYDGTVELTNDLALISDNSTITFDSTITGANALSADSNTGTSFGADVGTSTTKLTSLTVTGPATIGSSNIFTSGPQSFSGAVTLTTTPTPHTLTAETITFDAASTIDGDSDLALVTSAGTNFGAKVGSNTSLSSLEVTGPATVACTEITTSGNQHYKNNLLFTSDSNLTSTSGNLAFDSTVDGNQTITLKVPYDDTHTITFADKVGNAEIPSLIIEEGADTSFAKTVNVNDFTITKANNTVFEDTVNISTLTDTANAGNISFKNGGRISDSTGTVFLTTGILSLGDAEADEMTFGSDDSPADLIHTEGDTKITGTLNTANLTLADTSGGPMSINNSGLFKTLDNAALTYTTSFSQTGSGNTVLGGSFTGNGNAAFATNLQLYGSSQADFGSTGKNISVGKNLIINRDAGDSVNIKSSLQITKNLVLFMSPVIADADISAGKDILIFGSNYSETDTSTGITNEYDYTAPRHSDWSQPDYTETKLPDGTDVPATGFSATLSVTAGKTLSAGKNFYANGSELATNGTSGQWILKLPDLTNPVKGFAEAYHSVVSGCKVICNTGSSDGTRARLAALECTDAGSGTSTENTNVEFEDFKITKAYTVRDNAIRVEFNQPIRYHASTINTLNFHNASDAVSASTNFTGFYSDPDCQNELTQDITLSYTDEADGKTYYYFYIKAAPQDAADTGAWNTDATGSSSGSTEKSSDRYGIHHTALPCLDFPRSLVKADGSTLAFIITDIWGKRLNNYSRRVPLASAAEAAYGSVNSSDAGFVVSDKTGPVMWTVRTGQELHTAYSAATGEAGQHSYDAHNFLEFRYSEPVEFTPLDPALTENIQVTDSFGAIKESDIRQEASALTFAGIARLTAAAGSPLKLYTGKNGSADKYMNALYRTDEYSLRLSIAGWTDTTVSDYSGNSYKNWPGYIESASQFTGAKAAPVTSTGTPNTLIKDLEGNSQIEYAVNKIEPTVYSDSSSENTSHLLPVSPDLYSLWDISEPVFAPLRFSAETEWGNTEFSEAIGNTNGSGSTLDRIDFHFFDNTPAYDNSDPAEWFAESGWCIPGSEGSKDYLYDNSYTYAADIIGGARQFDPVSSRRTSGGIRLSTKLAAAAGFKYSTDTYETNPATSFATGLANIHTTVISQLFTGASEPQHSANDPDGLYLGIGITDTALPVETSFAFKYDHTKAYLTDLAGNRLRSTTSKTFDRTPPSFDIILSPVNQKQIYIVFVKELITEGTLKYTKENGENLDIDILSNLPACFQIISINSDGSYSASTDLQIDTAIPARLVDRYSDNHFTCICLTLNKAITNDDIKNLYIQLTHHPDYPETSPDPWTSNSNARVTFIQDRLGNYMQMYAAHALSDFAIGLVNPLYAYASDITENDEPVMNGLYEEGSWAVHDWNADQKNYGTLPAAHPAAIVTQQVDGTDDGSQLPENVRIYLSDSPDSGSVSTQFNRDFGTSLRVWLPDLTDGIFRSLSAKNNSHYSILDSEPMDNGNADNLIFNIPLEMINSWKSGDQISFIFGITESDGSPVKIYNSPYYDSEHKRYDFALSTPVPLYALRMHDNSDIGSLDLWSFRLKGITEQRGGVTILNNVINPTQGEKTMIKITLPAEGRLNVSILTADGNIITYLSRGNVKEGEHYFTWDGKNRKGEPVARGIYFVRVTGSGIDETRKVMIVK